MPTVCSVRTRLPSYVRANTSRESHHLRSVLSIVPATTPTRWRRPSTRHRPPDTSRAHPLRVRRRTSTRQDSQNSDAHRIVVGARISAASTAHGESDSETDCHNRNSLGKHQCERNHDPGQRGQSEERFVEVSAIGDDPEQHRTRRTDRPVDRPENSQAGSLQSIRPPLPGKRADRVI